MSATRGTPPTASLAQLEAQLTHARRLRAATADAGLERFGAGACLARDEAEHARADLDRETPNWRERVAEADRLEARGEAIELSDDRRVELRRPSPTSCRRKRSGLRDERGGLSPRRGSQMEALPGPAHVQGRHRGGAGGAGRRPTGRTTGWRCWRRRFPAAERAYRDAHQSPLLEAASTHLASITDGRYDRLIADDSTGDGRAPARAASRRGFSGRRRPPAEPRHPAADLPGAATGDGGTRWRARTPSGCRCSWTRCS